MKKTQIHQFDPVIYPFKLWVTCTDKYTPLNNRFCYAKSSEDLNRNVFETYEAVTFYIKEREKGGGFGCLVAFTSKEYFNISNMAHEASHVVDYLFEHIGEKNIGEESRAYLMGWVVDCMNQLKTNKFKNN
jgi:hypothetical protein